MDDEDAPPVPAYSHLILDGSSCDEQNGSIFLGSQKAADKHAWLALQSTVPPVTGIVNCTNYCPNHHEETIEYCNVAVNDEVGANLLIYMDGATQFMERHVTKGGSVLVHCQVGVSRSATIVCAFLIRYRGLSREDALRLVKERRPIAQPNTGFWKQLKVYEQRCRQREDDTSPPPTSTPVTFDRQWARQSLANYQTLGNMVDDPSECFPEFDYTTDAEHVLYRALDLIWGRGVLEADLSWICALCRALEPQHDAVGIVSSLLSDSYFTKLWEGEIYESQIRRVMEAIEPT